MFGTLLSTANFYEESLGADCILERAADWRAGKLVWVYCTVPIIKLRQETPNHSSLCTLCHHADSISSHSMCHQAYEIGS
jgi:hypothetical protein